MLIHVPSSVMVTLLCVTPVLMGCRSETTPETTRTDTAPQTPGETTTSSPAEVAPSPQALADSLQAQANAAKEQEGQALLGALTRSQQAYFLEKNTYATDVESLDLALSPTYYNLEIVEVTDAQMIAKATAKEAGIVSYAGGVSGFERIICASSPPSQTVESPVLQNEKWSCGASSTKVE